MKYKTLATILAGTILGSTTQNTLAQKRKDQDKPILGISGVEYKNYTGQTQYSLEIQEPFGKTNPYFGKRVYERNKNQDPGELDFVVSLIGQTEIITGTRVYLNQKEKYIPTVEAINGKIFKEFELYGLSAKAKKSLKKKIKKRKGESQSSFGYNYILTKEDIKEILPWTRINGKEYIYWDGTNGRFISENGENYANPENSKELFYLPEIYMPLKGNWGIKMNLECGNLTLYSDLGFYRPIKEDNQKIINQNETPKTTPAKEEKENKETCTYVTKPKDTYWKIAEEKCEDGKRFGELQKLNPKIPEREIPIGAEINIPCDCDN